jgi:hypothetical protein
MIETLGSKINLGFFEMTYFNYKTGLKHSGNEKPQRQRTLYIELSKFVSLHRIE